MNTLKYIKSTEIDYHGERCTLEVALRHEDINQRKRHTFVSLYLPWDPEDQAISWINERPYPSRKGEDTDNDKLWRKYNKLEIKLMQEAIDLAVTNNFIPEEIGKHLKFSRTYYCSCGCSPGFVYKDYGRKKYSITITSPSKELEKANRTKDILSQAEERTLASMVI